MADTTTRDSDSDTTDHDTRDAGHDTERDTTTHDTATPSAWERIATYGQYVPLPRRTTAVALYDGSVDGTARIWAWATEKGWDSLKTRGGLVGGGAVVTLYSIATTPPPINGALAVGAAITWATWALINAPSPAEKARRAREAEEAAKKAAREKEEKKAGKKKRRISTAKKEDHQEAAEETDHEASTGEVGRATRDRQETSATEPPSICQIKTRSDLLRWLQNAIGNRNGIHLDELHQRLSAEPGFATLERAHLTPLLDRQDIPYHRAISVDGIAGRTGVKRADLQALLKDSPTGDPQTP